LTEDISFSFVVPVYDRTQKLRESVRSLLRQNYANFEVILVCDGSPEPTLEVVSELEENPRVRSFKYRTNSGNACRGRNRGIMMAKGDFICFHDSDDIAHHERLNRTAAAIVAHDADGVYGPTRLLLDGTREIPDLYNGQLLDPPQFDFELLQQINLMMTCSVAVRRTSLFRFGMFRPEMRYREDHELWLRLAHNGCKWTRADGTLCYYRVHAGNAELILRGDDSYWFEQALYWYKRGY
jgi:glycosyltransferase involved in cell wall biosynthesis